MTLTQVTLLSVIAYVVLAWSACVFIKKSCAREISLKNKNKSALKPLEVTMTDHELIAAIRLLREEIRTVRQTASQLTMTFALPTPLSLKKELFASLHESPPSVQDLWLWPSYPSGSCSR